MSRDKKRSFKYIPRTKEQIDKRARQSGGLKDWFVPEEIKMFVPKEGGKGNIIRILPPTWENAEHYGYDVYIHFGIGAENSAFLCPKKMKNKPCPICEELNRAQKEKMPEEYIASLEVTKRVLMYVIDRKNEEDGPLLWSAAWTIDKDIAKRSRDKRTGEYRELDRVDSGHDVIIDREGTGLKTKYSIEIDREPTPLSDDDRLVEEWLDYITENPIPDILVYRDYDYIKEVFEVGGMYDSSKNKAKPQEEKKTFKFGKKRDVSEEEEEEIGIEAGDIVFSNEEEEEVDKRTVEEKMTWEEVHSLPRKKLLKMASEAGIDDDDVEEMEDDELADAICEAMEIEKKVTKKAISGKERLANLRKGKK